MPTLKTRAWLMCARNSKLIDGLRFCAVILCAIVGTGMSVFALTSIMHAEHLSDVKTSTSVYMTDMSRQHDEMMREKDARLAEQASIIKALTDRVVVASEAAENAAATANNASKTAESASKTANKAVQEIIQKGPRPITMPKAPMWLDGP